LAPDCRLPSPEASFRFRKQAGPVVTAVSTARGYQTMAEGQGKRCLTQRRQNRFQRIGSWRAVWSLRTCSVALNQRCRGRGRPRPGSWIEPLAPRTMRDSHEPGRSSLPASRIMADGTKAQREPCPTGPRYMGGGGGRRRPAGIKPWLASALAPPGHGLERRRSDGGFDGVRWVVQPAVAVFQVR